MKKFLKIILRKFVKNIIFILNLNRVGFYIMEYLAKYIFDQKKNINYNNINLSFYCPNRLNKFRIETFSSKEPETLKWIESFDKKSTFWDIGANIGLYTCYAAKLKNCYVYAFEPSIFNLEILAKNIFLNKLSSSVSIVPIPLTEKIKETDFNMSSTDWGSSISTFGEEYQHDGKSLKKEFQYKTLGISMNDAIEILKIKQPDNIKIDVDGIEHLILKGGLNALKRTKSILIEVDENFKLQSQKIQEYLVSAGFVLAEKKHSTLIEDSSYKSIFNQIWKKNNEKLV